MGRRFALPFLFLVMAHDLCCGCADADNGEEYDPCQRSKNQGFEPTEEKRSGKISISQMMAVAKKGKQTKTEGDGNEFCMAHRFPYLS